MKVAKNKERRRMKILALQLRKKNSVQDQKEKPLTKAEELQMKFVMSPRYHMALRAGHHNN
ncbi:MAG: hypothetical protein COS25_02230 [Candidatus Nealsonbacteria bacterium CG02_land_8_20_14_3_00_37_10]|uniref:Uncharacterized protein n=2 Tax=Candidatus Nealsoniibacteriota TaxID=1817911 RepID=A0A2G9YXZ0_9BACT|nr:MAG: hypothetical protein COX35_02550 [Candidatus Nealsonbacteria bacterium CG23_combo_of_CG06-09_8_20_14_all_37_18]PIV44990.1 MAG: hypothetical protein COS25_02230 [Candidatus Nealsonbacteria bacterium CG02_land_8_20_14_3_00_37_10]